MRKTKRRLAANSTDSSDSGEVEKIKKKRKVSESEESTDPTVSDKEEEESESESIPKEKITLKIAKNRIQPLKADDESSNSNSDIFENNVAEAEELHIKESGENGVSSKVNGTNSKSESDDDEDKDKETTNTNKKSDNKKNSDENMDEDKENTETQENGKKSEDEVVNNAPPEVKKPMIRLVPLTNLLKNPVPNAQKNDEVLSLSSESEGPSKATPKKNRKSVVTVDSSSEDEVIIKPTKKKKAVKKRKDRLNSDEEGSEPQKSSQPIEAMTTEELLKKFCSKKCRIRIKKENMKKVAKKNMMKRKKAEERRNTPGTSKTLWDSESDSEEVASSTRRAKTNRRKSDNGDDSDSDSFKSDESMSSIEVLPSKTRRRIVKPRDSSEADEDYGDAKPPAKVTKKKKKKGSSESDDDDDENAKTKRKNIRKLIKTKDLLAETKLAAKEEEERRKRIEERQKKYNEIYEKPESVELDELILDFDEETNEPLIQVDKGLIKVLKPHQAKGVKFMWDACFETVKDATEKPGSGCILAHCMGLGKTLQIVTLTHTLITNQDQTQVERALIISPLSTLNNWAREFQMWMKHCKKRNIEIYDMSRFKDKATRIFKLQEWFQEGGVCIMGYDMYRIFSNEKAKGLKKKQREILVNSLVDPGPDIVVCDEGHLLKNEKTSISKAVTKMRTRRRIVLTGTPLQNNLKEYYCMIQFIKPNLLGTYKEYLNRFVNPITNGQYADSTQYDMRLMKHRSHILHKLLEGCIQRRDYSVLAPYLPPKHEYVVYVTLSDIQKVVYEFYMREQRRLMSGDSQSKGASLFQDFQNLRRIWTHPMCLRVNSDILIQKKMMADDDEEGSLKDFIDDGSSSAHSSSDSSEEEDAASSASSKRQKVTRSNPNKRLSADIEDLPPKEDASEWWMKMVPDEELNNIHNSPKLIILFELLRECAEIGDKILVFSQSLQSLDVIEHFLSMIDQKTQGDDIDGNVGEYRGSWQPNVDYFRLDGSRSVDNRESMCKIFNDKNNLRARLFLISTRAGGLGINLVAANRVVIFDVSWNPSHDTQSIFRVYRFGQDKPCYIYRLLAMGTMEQKVYERQVTKQATAKRVIDEQQISRHYNQNDLQELYTYELEPPTEREIPILPKDKLFAELLSHRDKMIFKYHEHDSLLENEVSENLTEEERKAAWSEYEAEKSRPTTASSYIGYNRQAYGNYGSTGPVTTNKLFGFRTDILLRLLNLKAQKDNPSIPPESTGNLIPLYMQRLNSEMNCGDPTMYKELLELHSQLEAPYGHMMNPLLYANQNPVYHYPMSAGPPTQGYRNLPGATDTIEILDD